MRTSRTAVRHRPRHLGSVSRAGSMGASAFTPDAIAVAPRHLEVSGDWVSTLVITGYPREVGYGWLSPLLTYPGRVDLALHVQPIDPAIATARLRKQLAKLESTRQHTAERGRLVDPRAEAATEDAYDLSARLARGEGRLFRVGLYLTVHAGTERTLADEVAAVRALCASLLLDAKHTTYRSLEGWTTSLPLGMDLIGMRRTFDTPAAAAAFPFTSPDLTPVDPASLSAPAGILYGINLGSGNLVHWDRFAPGLHNHNAVVLGRSGSGKSFFVKLELLRSLYRSVEGLVIDPEDEYSRLAHAVGGQSIRLGAPGVRLNPFDLPVAIGPDGRRTAPRDALVRQSLFLHTVIATLMGAELTAPERAVLDRAVTAAYQSAGITADPRTWTRSAPTLRTLRDALAAASPVAADLAARLHPFVDGAFAGLFDGPTTATVQGHLVVFSLRDLPDEVRGVGTLLALDAVWRRVSDPTVRRPRLVVVDEAWSLMRQRAGAEFLYRTAKSIRRHWGGLTVSSQDILDFLGSELGKAITANAATQILFRQAPQAIDEIAHTFNLAAGDRRFLLAAERGQALFSVGAQRLAMEVTSSPTEYTLATSNPEDLADEAAQDRLPNTDDESYVDIDCITDTVADHESG